VYSGWWVCVVPSCARALFSESWVFVVYCVGLCTVTGGFVLCSVWSCVQSVVGLCCVICGAVYSEWWVCVLWCVGLCTVSGGFVLCSVWGCVQ
jgi:hypothetical protein